MPWLRWFPWRYIVKEVARAHGFIDPISVLSHLHRFAQPSEVAEPLELLRAGVVFHARGLMNTRAIQHNLDWIWPHWVERQFDPSDPAFIPRAFSITHVNLTHRNWSCVGVPDIDSLPVVDPAGLLMPFWDSWSLDTWLITDDGELIPSRNRATEQTLHLDQGVSVETECRSEVGSLKTYVKAELNDSDLLCRYQINCTSHQPGWLVVSLRPYNPEGVSFLHTVSLEAGGSSWLIDKKQRVIFQEKAEKHLFSTYHQGDVYSSIRRNEVPQLQGVTCDTGMATAAALFRVERDSPRTLDVIVPLGVKEWQLEQRSTTWDRALDGICKLQVPDEWCKFLFNAAIRTLVLLSPKDVYPGPYTYKRFWFRDAAFMVLSLLSLGYFDRARRVLDGFAARQTTQGYFLSQEGEWDSNGEALWILHQYLLVSGETPPESWFAPLEGGAGWIARKRIRSSSHPQVGLLPAGFSAEHLGPNDYYYWDNFWGIAGLKSAAAMLRHYGRETLADQYMREAQDFQATVDASIAQACKRLGQEVIPAAPTRRMDAGAIGSVVAGYPLQLYTPNDPRLLGTVEFLVQECSFEGAFFQDMIHSGINAYLTLHMAQVLLRANDRRYWDLMKTVAQLASPTGQWPEAIHPQTKGGCMGDGQHGWAASEWVMMVKNCFVREEEDDLIIGSGIPAEWYQGEGCECGPLHNRFGSITVAARERTSEIEVSWSARWRRQPARIIVQLPGYEAVVVADGQTSLRVPKSAFAYL